MILIRQCPHPVLFFLPWLMSSFLPSVQPVQNTKYFDCVDLSMSLMKKHLVWLLVPDGQLPTSWISGKSIPIDSWVAWDCTVVLWWNVYEVHFFGNTESTSHWKVDTPFHKPVWTYDTTLIYDNNYLWNAFLWKHNEYTSHWKVETPFHKPSYTCKNLSTCQYKSKSNRNG